MHKNRKSNMKTCTCVRKNAQNRAKRHFLTEKHLNALLAEENCYLSFRTSPKWMFDDSRELISIRSATDMP